MSVRPLRTLLLAALACAGLAACAPRAPVDEAELRAVVGDEPIVLLSAAWCGYCNKQRADFERWGVDFVEHDVETSDAGDRAYALLRARGVPIVLVNDQRIHGYAPSHVRELIEDASLLPAGAPR